VEKVDMPADADRPDPEMTRTREKAPARAWARRECRAAGLEEVGAGWALLEEGRGVEESARL
jgi:hypothetical protein